MSDEQIKAILIDSAASTPASDGKYVLLKLNRKNPDSHGATHYWFAIPNEVIPSLCAVAIKGLPQPPKLSTSMDMPYVFGAHEVTFGTDPEGRHVLSVNLDNGAGMSYELDDSQVATLALAMSQAVGGGHLKPPPGSKTN